MSLWADKNPRSGRLLANLAAAFYLLLAPSGQALAATTIPYFQANGGDVATGGWFNDDANKLSCTGSGYYQAPDWSNQKYKIGGILSFASNAGGSRLGAHSDYGVYSLGLIEYNAATGYGFYSGNSGLNSLSFANFFSVVPPGSGFNSGGSGGLFEGSAGHYSWHCIPDYYTDYLSSSATDLAGAGRLNLDQTPGGGSSQQYKDTLSGSIICVTTSSGNCGAAGAVGTYTVPAGKNYSLFIDGDVYINSNVAYAGHDATNIPRLALVVRGNIYIGKGVSRLDGVYVAQPKTGSETTSGQLWTCHDNSATPYDLASLKANCLSSITFNGSVIAAQVNPTRLGGDAATGSPAEIFNYTPETALGGSFNPPPQAGSGPVGQIDSLRSLAPVY